MVILLFVYTIFFLVLISYTFPRNTLMNNNYVARGYNCLFILISLYVVAVTDINYTDRVIYTKDFFDSINLSLTEHMEKSKFEPLYVISTNLISVITDNILVFYILLHVIFLIILLKGIKEIGGIYYRFIVIFIYINSFFYYSYILNGLRQGISMAFIILMLGSILNAKKITSLLSGIGAVLFHYSAMPVVIISFLLKYFDKVKINYLIFIYFIASVLYVLNLQSLFVGFFDVNYLTEYTNPDLLKAFGETNKISFLVFNSFFLLAFYFLYRFIFVLDEQYIFLYKIYISFSIYFILFGFVAFANRIAAYSWFVIPLLIGCFLLKSRSLLVNTLVLIIIVVTGLLSGIPQYFIQ